MARLALARLLLVCGVLLAAFGPALPARAAPGERCFTETNQCVAGRFLAYWDANGGLTRNGYPLTPERKEILEDGREYTVQYFERVRMEYHPENAAPYDVLLGQFGRQFFRERFGINAYAYEQTAAPVAPRPEMTFFPETGHNVGSRFLAYWQANGGLAQFGLPLGEELPEDFSPLGTPSRPLLVQYFERARFEYHPENAGTPYDVLLGQFGRDASLWAPNLAPPLAPFYLANPELRARLGGPTYPTNPADPGPRIDTGAGALLPFERGLMLAGVDGTIQVLCGTAEAGAAARDARGAFGFPDPWTPDRPVGGGPGPRPGTYVPPRGFGMLWLTPALRDCLGYATSPDATPYTQTLQRFARGGFLFSTPDGQAVYALFFEQRAPLDTTSLSPERAVNRYQRYTLPK